MYTHQPIQMYTHQPTQKHIHQPILKHIHQRIRIQKFKCTTEAPVRREMPILALITIHYPELILRTSSSRLVMYMLISMKTVMTSKVCLKDVMEKVYKPDTVTTRLVLSMENGRDGQSGHYVALRVVMGVYHSEIDLAMTQHQPMAVKFVAVSTVKRNFALSHAHAPLMDVGPPGVDGPHVAYLVDMEERQSEKELVPPQNPLMVVNLVMETDVKLEDAAKIHAQLTVIGALGLPGQARASLAGPEASSTELVTVITQPHLTEANSATVEVLMSAPFTLPPALSTAVGHSGHPGQAVASPVVKAVSL